MKNKNLELKNISAGKSTNRDRKVCTFALDRSRNQVDARKVYLSRHYRLAVSQKQQENATALQNHFDKSINTTNTNNYQSNITNNHHHQQYPTSLPNQTINKYLYCSISANRRKKSFTNITTFSVVKRNKCDPIGLELIGGNFTGIFIKSVKSDTAAQKSGLKAGMQIIKVNDVNFLDVNRETAYLTLMAGQTDYIQLECISNDKLYRRALNHLGDDFYLRTNFSKNIKSDSKEFCFKANEIFRVFDSTYSGRIGYYYAYRINQLDGSLVESGLLPNTSRANQMMKIKQADKMTRILESRKKGRCVVDWSLESTAANESNVFWGNLFPAYDRVKLQISDVMRPVVLFGKFSTNIMAYLENLHPNLFKVFKFRNGFDLHQIMDTSTMKQKHCLLHANPKYIQTLTSLQLVPIIVNINYRSKKCSKLFGKFVKRYKYATCENDVKNVATVEKLLNAKWDRLINIQNLVIAFESFGDRCWIGNLVNIINDCQKRPTWLSIENRYYHVNKVNENNLKNLMKRAMNMTQVDDQPTRISPQTVSTSLSDCTN